MALFPCPKCAETTRVTDCRDYGRERIYRRRRCTVCGYRFTTCELFLGDRPKRTGAPYPRPVVHEEEG